MHDLVDGLSGTVYIPDTSALIENPDVLDRLLTDGNVVVLLHQVIEELGRLQASRSKSEGVRHAARLVMRKMLEYRRHQLIHHNVERLFQPQPDPDAFRRTPAGGILAWEPDGATIEPYCAESGDNHILASAQRLAEVAKSNGHPGYEVVVISEDSNLLLKCDALSIVAENLRYGKVSLESVDEIYRGVVDGEIEEEAVQSFLDSGAPGERWLPFEDVILSQPSELLWNTGVVLRCGEELILTRANPDLERVEDLRYAQYWDRKRITYKPRPIRNFCSTPKCSWWSSTGRPAPARPG